MLVRDALELFASSICLLPFIFSATLRRNNSRGNLCILQAVARRRASYF